MKPNPTRTIAEIALIASHLHILRHSLGLDDNGHGNEYRNHYAVGPGCDTWRDCQELCELGFMRDNGAQSMWGGMHHFSVTENGKEQVRSLEPDLPKTTRAQRRYQAFLRADCGWTFIEWLKIRGREVALILAFACLTTRAADFGATDLRSVPLGYPVGRTPNHLSTNLTEFPGLIPPSISRAVGPSKPVVPLYRVYLSWQGSGSTDTVYRVRGVAWTNLPASLSNAWGWPVLLTTNGTSVIFSNDWRPGHGVFWSVSASNANSRTEVPVKSQIKP